MILGRKDVAGGPADLGTERDQGLDQHRRLDGHVQRTGDAGTGQRLAVAVFLAQRHQAGHLRLGHFDFLATPVGQGQIFYLVIGHCPVLQILFYRTLIFSAVRTNTDGRFSSISIFR